MDEPVVQQVEGIKKGKIEWMTYGLEMDVHPRNGYPRPIIITRNTEVLGKDAPESTVCPHGVDMIMAGNDKDVECDKDHKHDKCQPAFFLLHLENLEYVH